MDTTALHSAIKKIIKNHSFAFQQIGSSQTKLLELGSIVGTAQHFKAKGYTINTVNPSQKSDFIVKMGTRGFPWNFSHFEANSMNSSFELHMNLMVQGAHDSGIYCVDVGVVNPNVVPKSQPKTAWSHVPNGQLLAFAEAKKLVVYPMLLAQFIGIVHEIKPEFLNDPNTSGLPMFPTLITLGHFSGNSNVIVDGFLNRRFNVCIADNFDNRLSRVNLGLASSPFI